MSCGIECFCHNTQSPFPRDSLLPQPSNSTVKMIPAALGLVSVQGLFVDPFPSQEQWVPLLGTRQEKNSNCGFKKIYPNNNYKPNATPTKGCHHHRHQVMSNTCATTKMWWSLYIIQAVPTLSILYFSSVRSIVNNLAVATTCHGHGPAFHFSVRWRHCACHPRTSAVKYSTGVIVSLKSIGPSPS